MEKKTVALLKNISLFNQVPEAELQKLLEQGSQIEAYDKEEIIYLQNEVCDNLDVILRGAVTIQKIDYDGKVMTLSQFRTGEILGENLVFSKQNNFPMTISAKEDTELLHIKKQAILELCQINRDFLLNLLESLSGKTLILSERLKSSAKSIRQILTEFLLIEHYSQGSQKIQLGMSKKELAEKIGIQRSSLSRELNKMRQDGLIEFDAKCITLKDIAKLKRYKWDLPEQHS